MKTSTAQLDTLRGLESEVEDAIELSKIEPSASWESLLRRSQTLRPVVRPSRRIEKPSLGQRRRRKS